MLEETYDIGIDISGLELGYLIKLCCIINKIEPFEINNVRITYVFEPPGPAAKEFYTLAQNRATNLLHTKITVKIDPSQLDLLGNGVISSQDFRLSIRGYSELSNGVKQSAAMLLDSLLIAATNDNLQNTLVTLPLKEYMGMRGLRDEKEVRAQVKQDMDALGRISFEYEYRAKGKRRGMWLNVHISGGTYGQIKNGDIIFRFNQDFFDCLKEYERDKYMYMLFPFDALKGNIKQNPYKNSLARRISLHKHMNQDKPNEDVIGVRTLIKSCPNFPTYEAVMSGNRNVTKRIIEPFERDMNALNEFLTWEYNGADATKDYKNFISATVTVYWRNYPARAKRRRGEN